MKHVIPSRRGMRTAATTAPARARGRAPAYLETALRSAVETAASLDGAGAGILRTASLHLGCEAGLLWSLDSSTDTLRCVQTWSLPEAGLAEFEAENRDAAVHRRSIAPGQVWARLAWSSARVVWVSRIEAERFAGDSAARFGRHGFESCIALPLAGPAGVAGVAELFSRHRIPRSPWRDRAAHLVQQSAAHQVALLSATERRCESARMQAIARLAGEIGHSFNNSLAVISGQAELLLADVRTGRIDPAVVGEAATDILGSAREAAQLTRQLLAFAGRQSMRRAEFDLVATLRTVAAEVRAQAGPRFVFHVRTGPPRRVMGDARQIGDALRIVLFNAVEAMPEGGTVDVGVTSLDVTPSTSGLHGGVDPGRYAVITVSDDGVGMTAEAQRQLFDPFFTSAGLAMKKGLGLAAAYGIVRQSGGFLAARSGPGERTRLSLSLPTAGAVEEPRASCSEAPAVLVVDEHPQVVSLLAAHLRQSGFRPLGAGSGEEALRVASGEPRLRLLIADVTMPVMGGRELARRFLALHPENRVIMMSGYSRAHLEEVEPLPSGSGFVGKPFDLDELLTQLGEAAGKGWCS